jgi:S1-C subfamily serine protease
MADTNDDADDATVAAAAAAAAAIANVPAEADSRWQTTVKRVSQAVVVIKTTGVRAFDTETAGSAYATGFVVDMALGLILTNRHVLRPGPVVAEAVFQNREEVPLRALYCDPVHDFAFFRFDPALLQFHDVEEVPLAPEGASVGLEVRVVGNDSGEKLSILSATLARLDRDAPKYGSKGYNDFNTFYIQAASGTKGGSSGSPVIDIQGRAVGLNAGSKTKGTAAYYLPLFRVARALALLRSACPAVDGPATPEWLPYDIPRGTLQTTFAYKGFDECRRLGLRRETEAHLREAQGLDGTGALVVEDTVPGGPGEGNLEVGDVLVRVNGACVTDFVTLEATLDDSVGNKLTCVVERGDKEATVEVTVGDLHAVTPKRMLEICGGVVHSLSYQQARNFQTTVGLVYVAEPGYILGLAAVPKHAIITSLNNKPTPTTDDFAAVYATLEEGTRVPLQYYIHTERHRTKTALLHLQTKWYPPAVFYERNWTTGRWDRTTLEMKPPPPATAESAAKRRKKNNSADVVVEDTKKEEENGTTAAEAEVVGGGGGGDSGGGKAEAVAVKVEASLCLVQVDIATVALADGVYTRSFEGNGAIIHHDPGGDGLGLVLVDRNTVPVASCDILISFAAYPHETPGRVEYLHPTHNFALVSYDAAAIPAAAATAIKAIAMADPASPPLSRGDEVALVGLSAQLRPMARISAVTDATSSAGIPSADIPRFRAVNEEVIQLDIDFGYNFGGVLTDLDGKMLALWASYAKPVGSEVRDMVRGLPVAPICDARDEVLRWRTEGKRGVGSVRLLDAEFDTMMLAKAGNHGVPPEWIERLLAADPVRRQALTVASTVAATGADRVLEGGDVLLTAGGKPAVSFRAVEEAAAAAVAAFEASSRVTAAAGGSSSKSKKATRASTRIKNAGALSLPLTVLRKGNVVDVVAELSEESCAGTGRLLHWAGAQLQPTHRPVVELGYRPTSEDGRPLDVFISRWYHGSPAQRYGLYALNWVASVNGEPTPDIDTFVKVTQGLEDGSFVRLKLISLTARPKVLTVKLDLHYWPTWELRRTTDGTNEWERVLL